MTLGRIASAVFLLVFASGPGCGDDGGSQDDGDTTEAGPSPDDCLIEGNCCGSDDCGSAPDDTGAGPSICDNAVVTVFDCNGEISEPFEAQCEADLAAAGDCAGSFACLETVEACYMPPACTTEAEIGSCVADAASGPACAECLGSATDSGGDTSTGGTSSTDSDTGTAGSDSSTGG